MSDHVNRPRQLRKLVDYLNQHGTRSVTDAITAMSTKDGEVQSKVRDRLTLLVLHLPSMIETQACDVLGERAHKYMGQVERIKGHFSGRVLAGGVADWTAVFDQTSTLALGGLEDLIDFQLALTQADNATLSEIRGSIDELIDEIRSCQEIDDDLRTYLLEMALHLAQVLARFDVFGTEGVMEMQGNFLTTLVNLHEGLIGPDDAEEPTAGRRFANLLLDASRKAIAITSVPANALTIAAATQMALQRGH